MRQHLASALLVAVLASCTSAEDVANSPETTPGQSPSESGWSTEEPAPTSPAPRGPYGRQGNRLWVNTDFAPVTAPANVDGVAVIYTHFIGELTLVGIDPSTGEVMWQKPAAPPAEPPGIALEVHAVGDLVAYLEPAVDGSFESRLVLADPHTGEAVNQSEIAFFQSQPTVCEEAPGQACAEATRSSVGSPENYRMGRTGPLVAEPEQQLPPGFFSLGENGLVQKQGAHGDRIAVAEAGRLVWSRRVTHVFGPGYRTIAGWTFRYVKGANLHIGSVGYDLLAEPRQVLTETRQTVALDARTGEVVWRRRGADSFCRPDWLSSSPGSVSPYVVCTWRAGTVFYEGNDQDGFRPDATGTELSVARLDPVSGKVLWDVDVGRADRLVARPSSHLMTPVSDEEVYVDSDARRTLIDVRTGESEPARPSLEVWKPQLVQFRYEVPWVDSGKPFFLRYGSGLFQPETVGGSLVEDVPKAVPETVATVFDGDLRLVSSRDGVRAYRVP